jgi:hypothetical protein
MARKKGGQQLKELARRKPALKRSKSPAQLRRFGANTPKGVRIPRSKRSADTLPPVIVPGTERMRDALKNRLGVQPRQFGARIPRGTRSPALDTSMLLSPLGAGPAIRAGAKANRGAAIRKKPRKRVY